MASLGTELVSSAKADQLQGLGLGAVRKVVDEAAGGDGLGARREDRLDLVFHQLLLDLADAAGRLLAAPDAVQADVERDVQVGEGEGMLLGTVVVALLQLQGEVSPGAEDRGGEDAL